MRERIEAVATPDYAPQMLAANTPGRERIAAGPIGIGVAAGLQTLYSAVPIGYEVEAFTPSRARILTWGFTLLGNASAVEPAAYFGLTHTELRRLGGSWRIAATSAGFGPTPKLATKPGPLGAYDVVGLASRLTAMNRLRSAAIVAAAALALAGGAILAQPAPTTASANIGCSVATAPAGAITEVAGAITGGAIGGGNPVGDACNSVTDGAVEAVISPVKSALKGIAGGILGQITTWVSEGASWLMGEVIAEIDKTTTPQLTTKGFLSEYARMAQVASVLAAAMFVMALMEAVVQGSWAVLGKAVFVSVPLAFVGTSVAFVLVQLMFVVTDGMSHAVTVATQEHSTHFFKAAIGDLSHAGGKAGGAVAEVAQGPGTGTVGEAAGATAVPLFVTFVMAIVGAFAAFCVWIELWFRDASVYVVVLFMPLAAAAAISPRWAHVLRRYVEVIVTVIGSKFVIVSVVALAASLISEEGASFEHILAASALLLVACFCPLVFFRLVLSMEEGVSAALSRRGAAGGAVTMMQMAGGPQGFANMARSNWSGPEVWSVKGDQGGGHGGGGSERPPGFPSGGGAPEEEPGGAGAAETARGGVAGTEAAAGPARPIVAGAEAAADGARSTAHHLEQTGTAQAADDQASPPSPPPAAPGSPSSPAPSPPGADGEGGSVVSAADDQVVPDPPREQGPDRAPSEPPPRPPERFEEPEGRGSDE